MASAKFSYDELNQYNWNYLDHYICGDDPDFNELLEVRCNILCATDFKEK